MNKSVSFKLAKLLKEKRFDLITLNFYTNPRCKMFGIDEHGRHYYIKNKAKTLWISGNAATLDSKHIYYAPTIAEVVMWLYEKHGIWISVQPNEPYVDDDWCFTIFKNLKNNISLEGYNSPTEAYEAAIDYALKNSI